MNPEPLILFYNFAENERTHEMRSYLSREGYSHRTVRAPEYLHPLGYLFSLPGFAPDPAFNLGGNFHEEMLVMGGLSQNQVFDFLQFLRDRRLPPVKLKAMLTPMNAGWNSLQLYEELKKEYENLPKR